MAFLLKNWGKIAIAIYAVAMSYWQSDPFWMAAFIYGLIIWFLINKNLPERLRLSISIIIWFAFVMTSGLVYYTNHYTPRGPMIGTGEVVCKNDDRGPCGELFIEDTSKLDVPSWVKFFKSSEGELLWMGLLVIGLFVSYKNNNDNLYY